MSAEKMHLNMFLTASGYHQAGWRMPGAEPWRIQDLDYYVEIAQGCEAAKIDAIFFADSGAFGFLNFCPFEAVTLNTALAARTEYLGLISTCSTTFNEPYSLARRFAALDHLSGGRAGWNIVTSFNPDEGKANGNVDIPGHDQRYARADEFLAVVKELWTSWDEGAFVMDQESGTWIDADRVHPLHHHGEEFDVEGALSQPRSPQVYPVLVQAGASAQGLEFAAREAEVVFVAQPRLDGAKEFAADLRARVERNGRDPHSVKILPGFCPVMGKTAEEARERAAALTEKLDPEAAMRMLRAFFGKEIDLEKHPLDEPVPEELLAETDAHASRTKILAEAVRRDGLTMRQLIERSALGAGHKVEIGSYEQVADTMQEWFEQGAADGFNVQLTSLPGDLTEFLENVVPLLQERGLFRAEYEEKTLRERFGLATPAA